MEYRQATYFLDVPSTPAPGDLVELKSGGAALTVLDFCAECGEVDVAYTDSDGDIDILTLPSAALKPFEEEVG